jgi:hypothetical protein
MIPDAKPDYLVISRDQWDKDASKADIQQAIDEFHVWLTRSIDEGRMNPCMKHGRLYEIRPTDPVACLCF